MLIISANQPGGVCGELHAGECADGLVGEVERVERRRVEDVGDHLVPHEDVLQQVLQRAVRPARAAGALEWVEDSPYVLSLSAFLPRGWVAVHKFYLRR